MIIKEVYENKASGQLLVTIPRNKGVKKGDYVKIVVVPVNVEVY